MNKCLTRLVLTTVFLFGLTLSSSSAEAQIFGADDEDLKKIYFELKKFNAHLAEVKNQVLDEIHQQNKILQLFRQEQDRKSTRLNSSHALISYAVFCLKKKKKKKK